MDTFLLIINNSFKTFHNSHHILVRKFVRKKGFKFWREINAKNRMKASKASIETFEKGAKNDTYDAFLGNNTFEVKSKSKCEK